MIITLKFIRRSPIRLLANFPRHINDGFPNFQNSMAVKPLFYVHIHIMSNRAKFFLECA